jgi:uncharacterized protein YutE (UPF0331/DUF86 family)/predicted nucleotidyltransferase
MEPTIARDPEQALLFYFKRGAPEGILSVYLFAGDGEGGTFRESDLDVAVLLDPALHPDRKARGQLRLRLASDLIHALRDNHVDLVILNDSPPGLGKKVVTGWPRIYCSDQEGDHAFVRDVQLRAADLELFPTQGAQALFEIRPRPFLQHRLGDVRRHLDHLYAVRSRISNPETLAKDLSLYNDVRFGLLSVIQMVIDVAAEISVRRDLPFSDYSEAVRNLAAVDDFPPDLVEALALLPAFRNALLHPHVGLEPDQVVEQIENLQPIEELLVLVARHLDE